MSQFQTEINKLNAESNFISLSEFGGQIDSLKNYENVQDPRHKFKEILWRKSIGMPTLLALKEAKSTENKEVVADEMLTTEMGFLGIQYPKETLHKISEEKNAVFTKVKKKSKKNVQNFLLNQEFTIKHVVPKTDSGYIEEESSKIVKDKSGTIDGPIIISNCDDKFDLTGQLRTFMPENAILIPPRYRFHYGEHPSEQQFSFKDFDKIFDDLHFVVNDVDKEKEVNIELASSSKGQEHFKEEAKFKKSVAKNESKDHHKSHTTISLNLVQKEEETEVTVKVKISDEKDKKPKMGAKMACRRRKYRKLEFK